jgi:hypothetical protein
MSQELESRVRELEIKDARKDVIIENLVDVVSENTKAITELTAVLNRGKGAAWMMAGAYTFFGGAVGFLINYFKG